MKLKFTKDELKEQVLKHTPDSEKLIKDDEKMERFLQRLERKLKKIPAVGDKLSVIPVFISLTRAYMRKEYTDIPIGSLIAIVSGMIYVFSPVDLIPDALPGIGYLDDALVIRFVLDMVQDDVKEYKQWRKKNKK